MYLPVRTAERSVVGEAGGRAAGREGLQGPRHVVAIQGRDAGAGRAIRVGRAGRRRPRDVVAGRRRARAARRRRYHRYRARRHVVTLGGRNVAGAVVGDGAPRVAGVSPCDGRNDERGRGRGGVKRRIKIDE